MLLSRRNILKGLAGLLGAVSVTPLLGASVPKIEETKFKVGDCVLISSHSFIAKVYNNEKSFWGKIEDVGKGKWFDGGYWVSRVEHSNRTSKATYLVYPCEIEGHSFGM